MAKAEQQFESLTVGDTTYTNVTVVKANETHVSFSHTKGFATVRVREFDKETLKALGYEVEEPRPLLEIPPTLQNDPRFQQAQAEAARQIEALVQDPRFVQFVWAGAAVLLALHLFFSYCCMLICQKSGTKPGFLVWLPGLQAIPMLKAARMSGWLFLLLFVPVVSLLVSIFWIIRISQARSKGGGTIFCLLFPPTSLFAFLYLAFSGPHAEKPAATGKIQLSYQH